MCCWMNGYINAIILALLHAKGSLGTLNFERCNIERVDLGLYLGGRSHFSLPSSPIIFVYGNDTRDPLKSLLLIHFSSYENLLENHSEEVVTLSSSNSYSHGLKRESLKSYLLSLALNYSRDALIDANEDFYLFGANFQPLWKDLEDLYEVPPCLYCEKAGAKTIGIGRLFSGVSFHMHGPGFSEVIHGSKHWFLYPPDTYPSHFSPNMSMMEWYSAYYDTDYALNPNALYECTIHPNEVLFFPDRWVHGILNTAHYNFFVSLFLDIQLMVL